MLNRIFSNTNLILNDVTFQPGINIILGKYSGNKEALGINGIGKSSLVRLIDYALLSDSSQKIFSHEKYDFMRAENHDIVLEFTIQDKKYFIRRDFNTGSPVYFGENLNSLDEYTKDEIRAILTDKFFPMTDNKVFFEGNRFRTLMNFFVKDDLSNQERIDPLNFMKKRSPSEVEKSLYNFYLLNLPTERLVYYQDMSKEYNDFGRSISTLEINLKTDTGRSIEEYRSEKINIENKIVLLEKSLSNFKFADNYKNIEENILVLTNKINSQLNEYHSLNKKLANIKEGYNLDTGINTKEIRKLYNETLSTFGDLVAKTLDEVISFKKDVIDNRNKFLVEKEKKLNEQIKLKLSEISKLEEERSKLYKVLEEKGALESITNTYEQLITEKSSLEKNVQIVQQIDDIQEKMTNLNVSISETQRDLLTELKNFENEINSLRALFLDLLTHAIFVDENFDNAYFNLSPKRKVRQRTLPFKIDVEIPKAEALGNARYKIVAYDLMVFLNNIQKQRKLPDFLIHDGVFHGISPTTLINSVNYMFHAFLKHSEKFPFQYILTFNENEIFVNEQYGSFDFDVNEYIKAEYQDTPEKMIFKRIIN
jgi:uncharacterized protein YydD (DUF2326 family)